MLAEPGLTHKRTRCRFSSRGTDRITPYTSMERLKAIVIEKVPQVCGTIAALAVTTAPLVEAGDLRLPGSINDSWCWRSMSGGEPAS